MIMNCEALRRALHVQLNGHSLQQAEHKRDFAMKQQEIHLIDRAALRRLVESCPNLSRLQLAQTLIGQLKEDLDGMEAEQRELSPVEQELASLARLRPTDEQLHRALLRLLALRDGSDRPLLYK